LVFFGLAPIYQRMLRWAKHRNAPYYLGGLSFADASILPLPPDVMLVPMVLAQPHLAWRYAFITTLGSILGGLAGYLIGYWAFESFGMSLLQQLGQWQHYQWVVSAFKQWGVGMILLAGITPIPYKLFTLAAGVAHMSPGLFLISAIIGRGTRFYLVAALMKKYGPTYVPALFLWLENKLWLIVGLIGLIGLGWWLS